jgi:hypothetical protein
MVALRAVAIEHDFMLTAKTFMPDRGGRVLDMVSSG